MSAMCLFPFGCDILETDVIPDCNSNDAVFLAQIDVCRSQAPAFEHSLCGIKVAQGWGVPQKPLIIIIVK